MTRSTTFRAAALAAALTLGATAAAFAGDAASPAAARNAAHAGAAAVLTRALVDAVNSPDDGAIARLLDERLSPAARQPRDEIAAYLHGLREQGGGVVLGESRTTARGAMVAELWARRIDAGVEVVVQPDGADSTRLMRIHLNRPLRRGDALPAFPRDRMDDGGIVRVLDAELLRLADADQLSGVVLVARGDQVLFHRAYGVEDPLTRRPITERTRFHLASQGKMFTSIAIAQLVEQGRISLDDTVGELLPGQPWTAQARAITLRQLLSHTSGMGSLFDRPGYPEGHVFRTATERLAFFASEPLLFAPGERWSYSNEGFETLGAIVEAQTGARYVDHIRRSVLHPAGMGATFPDAPADSLADRAIPSPHRADDYFGVLPRVNASRGWNAGGSGGGHATAEDMFRFARAVVGGRLVSRAMVDTLAAPRVSQGGGRDYGYGLEPRQVNGRTVFGHGGGGPRGTAICTDLDVFADGTWTVAVMTNYDAPFCHVLKRAITEMLAVH